MTILQELHPHSKREIIPNTDSKLQDVIIEDFLLPLGLQLGAIHKGAIGAPEVLDEELVVPVADDRVSPGHHLAVEQE